jgi:hypothetical protein
MRGDSSEEGKTLPDVCGRAGREQSVDSGELKAIPGAKGLDGCVVTGGLDTLQKGNDFDAAVVPSNTVFACRVVVVIQDVVPKLGTLKAASASPGREIEREDNFVLVFFEGMRLAHAHRVE